MISRYCRGMSDVAILTVIFGVGFAAGFGARALISLRRRHAAKARR
jgi:hypothetical protein